jgi:tRNA U34 5-methylaminomethyl-2-thiouridine-forming methyltransferase MnmC
MSHIELAQTRDGSWTCFNKTYEEHYHNVSGAYTEARSIYVAPTELAARLETTAELFVLDPFLGLGYNSLVCLHEFSQLKATRFPDARLTLIAIEQDPEILAHLPGAIENSGQDDLKQFLAPFEHNIYYQTHGGLADCLANPAVDDSSGIAVKVVVGDTRSILPCLPQGMFHAVYHDPFSPRKQPELWTLQLFQQYARLLAANNGVVMTYSAAAPVRQGLRLAGFHVYPHALCLNKSGTIAFKSAREDFLPFSDLEMALMHSRSGIPYEDNETLSLSPAEILRCRVERQQASSLPSSSSIHRQYGYVPARPGKTI